MDQPDLRSAEHYINRELSLLEFNERVLAQALDERVPLLERLKFLCISSNNLDEFFEIRVAGLKQRIELGSDQPGPDGMTITEQLQAIHERTRRLVDAQYACLNDVLLPALRHQGIELLARANLGRRHRPGSSSISSARSSRCCRRWGWIRRARFRASRTRA